MGQSAAGQVQASPPPPPADGAAVPFPDPLASTQMTGPADGQADDLLSQLAGAEIDRMLAEADVEPAVDLPPPPPPPLPVAAEPAVVEPAAIKPAAIEPAAVEPVVALPAAAEPAFAPAVADPTQVPGVEPATSIDLNVVLSAAAGEPSPGPETSLDGLLTPSTRASWVVRLLESASAPLDGWPDAVRETIGKVAVVTLANAAAILTYVFVFRRHG